MSPEYQQGPLKEFVPKIQFPTGNEYTQDSIEPPVNETTPLLPARTSSALLPGREPRPVRPLPLAPPTVYGANTAFSVNYRIANKALQQIETEIKTLRGWPGERVATLGGVVAGAAVVAGGVAIVVLTGGVALMPIVGVAAGLAAGAGGVLGFNVTDRGKRRCRENALLIEKLALLDHLRQEMRQNCRGLSPVQKQLSNDIKRVHRAVHAGPIIEIYRLVVATAKGVFFPVVAAVTTGLSIVFGFLCIAGGAQIKRWGWRWGWARNPVTAPPGQRHEAGSTDATGAYLTAAQIDRLLTPAL